MKSKHHKRWIVTVGPVAFCCLALVPTTSIAADQPPTTYGWQKAREVLANPAVQQSFGNIVGELTKPKPKATKASANGSPGNIPGEIAKPNPKATQAPLIGPQTATQPGSTTFASGPLVSKPIDPKARLVALELPIAWFKQP